VLGWLIAEREDVDLAQQPIVNSVAGHDIEPGRLALYAARCTPTAATACAPNRWQPG